MGARAAVIATRGWPAGSAAGGAVCPAVPGQASAAAGISPVSAGTPGTFRDREASTAAGIGPVISGALSTSRGGKAYTSAGGGTVGSCVVGTTRPGAAVGTGSRASHARAAATGSRSCGEAVHSRPRSGPAGAGAVV
jgi:hypothetical protein